MILEVSNVLSHYFSANHDILDKYERAPCVINEDPAQFKPQVKYDLIVSISTLEHVGLDFGEIAEPTKLISAIKNLRNSLSRNGKMMITYPINYNRTLDKLGKDGVIEFETCHCLKRVSKDNEWVEVNWNDIRDARYNHPFPAANELIICFLSPEASNSK